ncbi:MAG: DUF4333 domain-containing protein [Actinophytocola sp.]|nr:DUF4333 domain-containing protein [Actinophytocola sp.]
MGARSVATLLVMVVAALSTGCSPRNVIPVTPSPSPTSSVGSVTATPPAVGRSAGQTARMFDHTVVQDDVYTLLARHYRIDDVELVVCPPNRPVERGTAFRCTATIAGEQKSVRITVTSDKGDYQVARPK